VKKIAGLMIATLVVAEFPAYAQPDGPSSASRIKQTLLAAGLQGSTGSAIGPDGALYVPEGGAGRVVRIDTQTGSVTTVVSGLPKSPVSPAFGATDVAFLGNTAYVLVTMVSSDVGGKDIDGIYRVDGPNLFTVVANIGRWSVAHPPKLPVDIPTGVQYALQDYRGNFLVTDGHHNRVLKVRVDGCAPAPADDSNVTELIAFDNVVPTGLDVSGNSVYLAEAGPTPHLPEDGKIVQIHSYPPAAKEIASGARLLVDVEGGPHHHLYALSQGIWKGSQAGDPAEPKTGSLLRVNEDGSFTTLLKGLDRPTSIEFIGETAYVISLAGEVWKFENISCSHRHRIGNR
jgi:hypothetical protein